MVTGHENEEPYVTWYDYAPYLHASNQFCRLPPWRDTAPRTPVCWCPLAEVEVDVALGVEGKWEVIIVLKRQVVELKFKF
jgi:hypothetical protein